MRRLADVDDSTVEEPPAGMPSPPEIDTAVGALMLLADATRLRMLWVLGDGEQTVGSLAVAAGTSPAAASQHLAKLRLAGLVEARQQGKYRVYSTRGGHVRRLVEEALYFAGHRVLGEPDHG